MDQLASTIQIFILLASLAVWGMVFERLSTGEPLVRRMVPATRPRSWWSIGFVLLLLSVSMLGQFAKSRMPVKPVVFEVGRMLEFTLENILVQFTTVSVLVVCLTRLGSHRLTRFGIDGRTPGEDIGTGFMGYLAAVIPVALMNIAMSPFQTDDNQHIFLQILRSNQSIPLVALMVASAVIMAPLGEELMYRVILQGTLQRYLSPAAAILISSLLFSAVHGFPDALGLFPLALILGFLYWRTGSYLSIITTHAVFNGVTLILTIMSPGE